MKNIHIVSLFPEIFDSRCSASMIYRAINAGHIHIQMHNIRDYSKLKHQQVDDDIYGGGQGLLIMAQPVIDCINDIITKYIKSTSNRKILYPSPSARVRDQYIATSYATDISDIIIVCGRYEGIDHRRELYMQDHYPDHLDKVSIGRYVLFGGEVASMCMIESFTRLIDGVIQNGVPISESYDITTDMNHIEYPHYTRPLDVYGYTVPDILLSGHHAQIESRRSQQKTEI